jgi:fructosamine-3-kinase
MPLLENDISWDVLRRIVHQWTGTSAELAEVKRLVGGCINSTVALTTADGDRAVLKIATHRVNRDLHREAHQLRMLRYLGLPVPQVYLHHVADLDDPHSYLLMEFIEGVDLGTARRQCDPEKYDDLQRHLAELVLTLHEHTSPQFHRLTPEEPPRFDHWPAFYRHVYDPIWRELEKSAQVPTKMRKTIARVHDRLDDLLAHDDRPRLVHWDIWATNLLVRPDADGRWRVAALLDPNCKFAHAEAEIAYMELFQTITPAFLKTYQQQHRLGDTYQRVRKPIYQLYPLINHVNLFGNGYLKPLTGVVERVAALL